MHLTQKKVRAVAFCFDSRYAQYCAVAIFSLLINNGWSLKLFCVHSEDVSTEDKELILRVCGTFGTKVTFIDATAKLSRHQYGPSPLLPHVSSATWIRLFLPELLVTEDTILYLDCDVIVDSNLDALFDINLSEYAFAGAEDRRGGLVSQISEMYKNPYINTGVLLMNLRRLRDENFIQETEELFIKHEKALSFGDQCLINIYGKDRKLTFSDEFNFLASPLMKELSKEDWLAALGKKKIFHFISATKPWHDNARQHYQDLWWSYAKLLKSKRLRLIENNRLSDLLYKCQSLDESGNFAESSRLKSAIIESILATR